MAKKYGTLDEVLTIATGLNKEQRKDWNAKQDQLFAKRAQLKAEGKDSTAVDAQILAMM